MRSSLAIDALSAHRAHNALPEPWLDLAYGRLSAEEAAAAMAGQEPPELVARSVALFVPASAEEAERRLEALLETYFAVPEPKRRRSPRWLMAGALGLAAAAAAAGLVLVLVPSAPAPFDGGYGLTVSPGYLDERDEPVAAGGVVRYREGQRIELVLQPSTTVGEPVSAVAFAVGEDGQGRRLAALPEVNEHRVVVLGGTSETLGLSIGRWRLVVVVGPPDALPQAFPEVRDDAKAPYDVVERAVEIVAAPAPTP